MLAYLIRRAFRDFVTVIYAPLPGSGTPQPTATAKASLFGRKRGFDGQYSLGRGTRVPNADAAGCCRHLTSRLPGWSRFWHVVGGPEGQSSRRPDYASGRAWMDLRNWTSARS